MAIDDTEKLTKTTSPRKIAANRRNAQHSTGPKTPEGKARSSVNAVKHGIFLRQFLSAATPEAAEEIEQLAVRMWEHYKPKDIVQEIYFQKIVVESIRYRRVLGLEEESDLSNEAIPSDRTMVQPMQSE